MIDDIYSKPAEGVAVQVFISYVMMHKFISTLLLKACNKNKKLRSVF